MQLGRCYDCSYQWLKNGVLLEPPPWNFLYIGKGSVRITQLRAIDEGFYQCLASNSYGTAMSNVTYLQRAVLDSYGGGTVIEEKRGLTEGQPFTLQYKPAKCVPPPIITWSLQDDLIGKSHTGIVTDKRVQIDVDGEQCSVSFISTCTYVCCTSRFSSMYHPYKAYQRLLTVGRLYRGDTCLRIWYQKLASTCIQIFLIQATYARFWYWILECVTPIILKIRLELQHNLWLSGNSFSKLDHWHCHLFS